MAARNRTRARKARSIERFPNLRDQFPGHHHLVPTDRRGATEASEPPATLLDISLRLKVAMAVVAVCGIALKNQYADNDADVAVVLQRCVADELDRQIGRIDQLAAGGAS